MFKYGYMILLISCMVSQQFKMFPDGNYSKDIPTLNDVVGHEWGEKISNHTETEKYIHSLAKTSENVKLVEYGKTWEGRTLYYLIIGSKNNLNRLEEIKSNVYKLSYPYTLNSSSAKNIINSTPSIAWLSYGVHGNEISSTDAALYLSYHIAASQNDPLVNEILKETIVIIDPLQNPDGKDRFVNYFRQTTGRFADANPLSAEHREAWPGGRTNHYLFDMNRDWFAQTQPETKSKVKAYLEWNPQVFVDLHEMGSNSSYYFAPPAEPINPEVPQAQRKWFDVFGKNNAKWFDKHGFDYYTREIFDLFYPGYGDGWPVLNGAIGMTFEQASARGLVVDRSDNTTMHYRETVQHHFISSLGTIETAAKNREKLLTYFYNYKKNSIRSGKNDKIKEFILLPGKDPNRSKKLAELLSSQGIDVQVSQKSFTSESAQDYYSNKVKSSKVLKGSYIIKLAQPSKRLIKTLLAKHISMGKKFIKEQIERRKRREGNQIYDFTGWSLPLIFDVDALIAYERSYVKTVSLKDVKNKKESVDQARLSYIIPWGTNSAGKILGELLRNDVRMYTSNKKFTLNKKPFPKGSLLIKVKDNKANIYDELKLLSEKYHTKIYSTDNSWVDNGVNLGSDHVKFIKKPKIVIAYNSPFSSNSIGWTRYLIEQEYNYPTTLVHANQFGRFNLEKYNVLILPSSWGGPGSAFGKSTVDKIKRWVRSGGNLVTYGGSTLWLTRKNIGLLSTVRELKDGTLDTPKRKATKPKKVSIDKFDYKKSIEPLDEFPSRVTGAIMRIKLDEKHWLANGYSGATNVMVNSNRILTPVRINRGTNVGVFETKDKLVLSGFVWEDTQKQLAQKPYLMHESYGRGNVIAFTEDPNERAFFDGLNILFLNSVFLSNAY